MAGRRLSAYLSRASPRRMPAFTNFARPSLSRARAKRPTFPARPFVLHVRHEQRAQKRMILNAPPLPSDSSARARARRVRSNYEGRPGRVRDRDAVPTCPCRTLSLPSIRHDNMRLRRSLWSPLISRGLEGRQAPKLCRPSLQKTYLLFNLSSRQPAISRPTSPEGR
jgi:hypothetical protein